MKSILALFTVLLLFSCKEENNTSNEFSNELDDKELISLRNEVEQLRHQSKIKDSVINESISFFNEIQDNLIKISIKQDQIRVKSSNPELTNDEKEWVLQEIQNINFLREENARKVNKLQGQVKNQAIKISELEAMIERLVLQIKSRDEQIESLQNTLADLDMEYSELFAQYRDQVDLALDVMKELNTVYYAYGTIDELVDNNVIVREGGFIGIGKKTNIAEDFNASYFQSLDKTKVKSINIVGDKPQIVTDHPSNSYEWKDNKILIKDPDAFWKVSKFLVVKVK